MACVNYRKMYSILCGTASDAIDLIDRGHYDRAAKELRSALTETEELYIRGDRARGRKVWSWVKIAAPYILGAIILAALLAVAFFWGGMMALHGGYLV